MGDPVWPTTASGLTMTVEQMYTAFYRVALTKTLSSWLLADVVLSMFPETSHFTTMPFQPQLHEYSVTFIVDFNVNRTTDDRADIAVMTSVIKTVFADTLEVAATDIRILSLHTTKDRLGSALSVEIRVADEDTMEKIAKKLESDAPETNKKLLEEVKESEHFVSGATSVTTRTDSIRGTKDTKSVSVNDSTSPVVLIVVIIGVVLFVGAMGFYCYTNNSMQNGEVEAGAMDDGQAAVDGGQGNNQEYLPPPSAPQGMQGGPGMAPASQIVYTSLPRQDAPYPQYYPPQYDVYGNRYM